MFKSSVTKRMALFFSKRIGVDLQRLFPIRESKFWLWFYALLSFFMQTGVSAQQGLPQTITSWDDWELWVKHKNHMIISLKIDEQQARASFVAKDLEYVPALGAGIRYLDDRKAQPFGAFALDQTLFREYFLSYSQKNKWGTSLSFQLGLLDQRQTFINPLLNQSTQVPFSNATLGLRFSQSLWKNAWGHLSKIQDEQQKVTLKLKELQILAEELNQLTQAEQALLDYLLARETIGIRLRALEQAKKLKDWVQGRVDRNISDKSDLYGVQAMVLQKTLSYEEAQEQFKRAELKLRSILNLAWGDSLPELKVKLESMTHPLDQRFSNSATWDSLQRVDVLLKKEEFNLKHIASQRVQEELKPDLVLEGAWNTNSIATDPQSSLDQITNANRPTAALALKFQWLWDTEAKKAQLQAVTLDKSSTQNKLQQLEFEQEAQKKEWQSLYAELLGKEKLALQSYQLLQKKLDAEKLLLKSGRLVTSQVINSEQELWEALLNTLRIKVQRLKLAAATRVYLDQNSIHSSW